ncbi:HNH endonuclease, partial [Vibrio phage K250 g1]
MQTMTKDLADKLLSYNPDTGVFTWKHRSRDMFSTNKGFAVWNGKHSGKEAGCVHKANEKSYIRISILGKDYYAHRIAILMVTGEMPKEVDHRNGNGMDNRLSNLKPMSHIENMRNQKLRITNKSGVHGVGFVASRGYYSAKIKVNYKDIYLGTTKDFFEACCLRKSAENKYGFAKNHGEIRGKY